MTAWSPSEVTYQAAVLRAHAQLGDSAETWMPPAAGAGDHRVRASVLDSWRRSLAHLSSQTAPRTHLAYDEASLREARDQHAFALVLPLLRSRLIEPATDAGLLVALGDAAGRLLWVEGESPARHLAENMGFVPGADWSESVMGTSAPALALMTNSAVRIAGAEHFAEVVHPWSCSAVPVRHPFTGETLGIIDITGGPEAVSPLVVPLLELTARAVQDELGAHLRTHGPGRRPAPRRPAAAAPPRRTGVPRLHLTGRGTALLTAGTQSLELSGRHAELLTLLHRHPDGLSGAKLAEDVHDRPGSEGTVRAELVRLRKVLQDFAGGAHGLVLTSRPYRLVGPLDSDLARVLAALDRGDVDGVLANYRGHLLPASEAPAIRVLREQTHALVRETVLAQGSWQQVWDYARLPEASDDVDALMTVLRLAPGDAPERAAALVRAETLEAEDRVA